MDFRHLIVTCLFSMLRLSFETQKIKENYAILTFKPAYNPSNRNLYPLPSASADGRKKKIYLIFKGLTPTEEPAKPDIYSSVC